MTDLQWEADEYKQALMVNGLDITTNVSDASSQEY